MPSITSLVALLSASAMLVAGQAGPWTLSFYPLESGCPAAPSSNQNYTGGIGCTPIGPEVAYGGYTQFGSIKVFNIGSGGALTPRVYTDGACTDEFSGIAAADGVDGCYNTYGQGAAPGWIEVDQAGS